MDNLKIGSLESMANESFANRPQQAKEAVDEYLDNMSDDDSAPLRSKLEDPVYRKQFETAMTHTSLIVFIMAFKVSQNNVKINLDQYFREFLLHARKDDKDVYQMRAFYLKNLDSEEMGIGMATSEDDPTLESASEAMRTEYDRDRRQLISKYLEAKNFLATEAD